MNGEHSRVKNERQFFFSSSKSTRLELQGKIDNDCGPIKVSVTLKSNHQEKPVGVALDKKNCQPKIVTPATAATRYVENLLLGQVSEYSLEEPRQTKELYESSQIIEDFDFAQNKEEDIKTRTKVIVNLHSIEEDHDVMQEELDETEASFIKKTSNTCSKDSPEMEKEVNLGLSFEDEDDTTLEDFGLYLSAKPPSALSDTESVNYELVDIHTDDASFHLKEAITLPLSGNSSILNQKQCQNCVDNFPVKKRSKMVRFASEVQFNQLKSLSAETQNEVTINCTDNKTVVNEKETLNEDKNDS